MPGFVDVHSHVIPSGDDGAQSLDEGLALCREAAEHGTQVLYGTPHVLPGEGLDRDRERRVRAAGSTGSWWCAPAFRTISIPSRSPGGA